MMTDQQRELLEEYDFHIVEERWSGMDGMDRNIDRSRRIASTYVIHMTGTYGVQKLLDRLAAAESTRKTRVEKI